jgi:O-antigen biosynthesis protein WbqP
MIGVFYTKAKSTNGESMYKKFFKRLFDIIFSLLGIIFLALPMLIIVIIIRIDSKGRAVFSQTRVGLHKKPFKIYKFRTMYIETPENIPSRDFEDPRRWITKPGRILRKTSLDEIPQLFNILKGEMSFIGPRPVIPNEDDLIALRDANGSNSVLPGLTGWAQVNGRDELESLPKSKFDGEYVKALEKGFFSAVSMDVKCIFMTVKSVIKKEGILDNHYYEDESEKPKNETKIR